MNYNSKLQKFSYIFTFVTQIILIAVLPFFLFKGVSTKNHHLIGSEYIPYDALWIYLVIVFILCLLGIIALIVQMLVREPKIQNACGFILLMSTTSYLMPFLGFFLLLDSPAILVDENQFSYRKKQIYRKIGLIGMIVFAAHLVLIMIAPILVTGRLGIFYQLEVHMYRSYYFLMPWGIVFGTICIVMSSLALWKNTAKFDFFALISLFPIAFLSAFLSLIFAGLLIIAKRSEFTQLCAKILA